MDFSTILANRLRRLTGGITGAQPTTTAENKASALRRSLDALEGVTGLDDLRETIRRKLSELPSLVNLNNNVLSVIASNLGTEVLRGTSKTMKGALGETLVADDGGGHRVGSCLEEMKKDDTSCTPGYSPPLRCKGVYSSYKHKYCPKIYFDVIRFVEQNGNANPNSLYCVAFFDILWGRLGIYGLEEGDENMTCPWDVIYPLRPDVTPIYGMSGPYKGYIFPEDIPVMIEKINGRNERRKDVWEPRWLHKCVNIEIVMVPNGRKLEDFSDEEISFAKENFRRPKPGTPTVVVEQVDRRGRITGCSVTLDDELTRMGYSFEPRPSQTGDTLTVRHHWESATIKYLRRRGWVVMSSGDGFEIGQRLRGKYEHYFYEDDQQYDSPLDRDCLIELRITYRERPQILELNQDIATEEDMPYYRKLKCTRCTNFQYVLYHAGRDYEQYLSDDVFDILDILDNQNNIWDSSSLLCTSCRTEPPPKRRKTGEE